MEGLGFGECGECAGSGERLVEVPIEQDSAVAEADSEVGEGGGKSEAGDLVDMVREYTLYGCDTSRTGWDLLLCCTLTERRRRGPPVRLSKFCRSHIFSSGKRTFPSSYGHCRVSSTWDVLH